MKTSLVNELHWGFRSVVGQLLWVSPIQVTMNLFFSYAKGRKCEGCLKEEIDIFNVFCWIRKILQTHSLFRCLTLLFLIRSKKMDVQWENMGKILAFHEKEFTKKIVPKNKLMPEMIEDLRKQIQRLKTHLVMRWRTQSSLLMIQKKMNHLFLDLVQAAKLCGMNQIVMVRSSSLMWLLSKNQKIKF